MSERSVPSLAWMPWAAVAALLLVAGGFTVAAQLELVDAFVPWIFVAAALLLMPVAVLRVVRAPGARIATTAVALGQPFVLWLQASGSRCRLWAEIDIETDRMARPAHPELFLELQVDGEPSAGVVCCARWPHKGWHRNAMTKDRTWHLSGQRTAADALYCLDVHIDGSRLRALSALRDVHPNRGAQFAIRGRVRGEPWMSAGTVVLFVTEQ